MFSNDPSLKHGKRQTDNGRSVQVRKNAYQHGVKIKRNLTVAIRNHEQTPSEVTRTALLVACGKALGYVELRDAMTPYVASDELTKEIGGKAKLHLKNLEKSEP